MYKPKHVTAGLYALFYEYMKDIAREYGYNLVVHGSMNRDLDLILIPWEDGLTHNHEQSVIKEFQQYLTGKLEINSVGLVPYTILPGGRHSYIIDINRGDRHGEWVRFKDKQWYVDISAIPPVKSEAKAKNDG